MRIDELKRIAEENDYEFENNSARIILTREWEDGLHEITINKILRCRLWISMSDECFDKDYRMIKASIEFAGTDPEDREEEHKFYLKHRYLRSTSGNILYFSIYIEYDFFILTYRRHSSETKQQFSLKEIEEIKKKFDTDLKDFELVEVVDEN